MATYLDFDKDNNASQGFTHKFQTSTLEADHPPFGDKSNKVATTGWVSNLLEGNPMYPQVVQAGNLSINITEGYIEDLQGNPTLIASTLIPISVVGASTEYVYIRYSDMKPVVSTISPSPIQGFLLATVISDSTQILSINQVTPGPTGLASNDSPFFTGDPKAPHPPQGDYDNSIATTQWVKDELISTLGSGFINRPTISLSPPSTLFWSKGEVNIEGVVYPVEEGSKVFGLEDNGLFTIRAILQTGSTTRVEVSKEISAIPHTDLASVEVIAGVMGELSIVSEVVTLGDVSNALVTTQYLYDSLMIMCHGVEVPRVWLNQDKTQLHWSSGRITINNLQVDINEGVVDINSSVGYYYLIGQSNQNSLGLVAQLPIGHYRVLSRVEINSNRVAAIYPALPGFGN